MCAEYGRFLCEFKDHDEHQMHPKPGCGVGSFMLETYAIGDECPLREGEWTTDDGVVIKTAGGRVVEIRHELRNP